MNLGLKYFKILRFDQAAVVHGANHKIHVCLFKHYLSSFDRYEGNKSFHNTYKTHHCMIIQSINII
jgi:hypothetical protein